MTELLNELKEIKDMVKTFDSQKTEEINKLKSSAELWKKKHDELREWLNFNYPDIIEQFVIFEGGIK